LTQQLPQPQRRQRRGFVAAQKRGRKLCSVDKANVLETSQLWRDTVIEVDGHIGHGAVIHGARVGRNALVGMNSVVMDGVVIGESSIVAAMSFVKTGMIIPPKSLVMGSPARITRTLSDEEITWKSRGTKEYQQLAIRCLQGMEEVTPLTTVEADRKRVRLDNPHDLIKPKMPVS
jgi:phenylacetic acid degradation protein